MKTKIIFFALLIVVTAAFISIKTAYASTDGPHGGQLKEVDNYNIEVNAVYSHFYVYLLDKQNKTISSRDLTAEIRFFLYDGTNLDIPLKPQAKEGFELQYFKFDYNSYRITFQVDGKSVSAKFENESILVKNK